jgi:hypothetical protein
VLPSVAKPLATKQSRRRYTPHWIASVSALAMTPVPARNLSVPRRGTYRFLSLEPIGS